MMADGMAVHLGERRDETGRPSVIIGVKPSPDDKYVLREMTVAEARALEEALQRVRQESERIWRAEHGYECPNCGAQVDSLIRHRFVVAFPDDDERAWACRGKATRR